MLARLRAGDTVCQIAQDGLMWRNKATRLREVRRGQGWLDPEKPLPQEAEIARGLRRSKRGSSTISSAEPWREQECQFVQPDQDRSAERI